MPSIIRAMPTATALTRGRLQMTAGRPPMTAPTRPAASTPSQGDPGAWQTTKPLSAPRNRLPSWPRLTRPAFSLMHSPRLTYRYGVPIRMARLPTTRGMLHSPSSVVGSLTGLPPGSDGHLVRPGRDRAGRQLPFLVLPRLEDAEAGVAGLERQDQQDGNAGQHVHRGVGQVQTALQGVGGGLESAEEDGRRQDAERVLAGDEGDQDAGEAELLHVKGRVGLVLDGRDLHGPGQAGGGAAEGAGDQNEPAHGQAG